MQHLEALPAPEEEGFEQKMWMLEGWQRQCSDKGLPARWTAREDGQKLIDSFLNGKGKVVPVTVTISEGHHG